MTFSASAPAVFTYQRTANSIDPLIVHSDNTLVTPDNPANAGETLVIYATGAAKLNNAPQDGAPAPASPLATTVDTPTVTVGSARATVQFSGLTPGFVGLLQINIQLPAVLPRRTGSPASLPLLISFPSAVSAPVNLWVQAANVMVFRSNTSQRVSRGRGQEVIGRMEHWPQKIG